MLQKCYSSYICTTGKHMCKILLIIIMQVQLELTCKLFSIRASNNHTSQSNVYTYSVLIL